MRNRTFATYEESKHLVELTGFNNVDYRYSPYGELEPCIGINKHHIPAYSLADLIGMVPHVFFDQYNIEGIYPFVVSVHKNHYPLPQITEGHEWFQAGSDESYIEAMIVLIKTLKENNLI